VTDDTAAAPAEAAPPAWQRHDALVVAVAAVLLVIGAIAYRALTRPALVAFSQSGLRFERPNGFFPPEDVDVPTSSLAGLGGLAEPGAPASKSSRYHKLYKTPDGPLIGLEVLIERRPDYQGLAIVLQQARKLRYGEYMWTADAGEVELRSHIWQRTEFQYAVKATADDAPQVATGIEYATVNGDRLYVVTLHGTEREARRLESFVRPTLELTSAEK